LAYLSQKPWHESVRGKGNLGHQGLCATEPTVDVTATIASVPSGVNVSIENSNLADVVIIVDNFGNAPTGSEIEIDISADLGTDTDRVTVRFSDTNSASAICFATGTGIATPDGEQAVERLRPGDLVRTADGRSVPVKWIGRQTRNKLFTPEDRLRPVRVSAGALGPGVPHANLVLTADHALILDGYAINAGALVNGTTITQEPIAALDYSVTYYHVETEAHEVILANGAPAESFVDYVSRASFDNGAYVAVSLPVPEMDLPRISSARLVPLHLSERLSGNIASAA
jgi:hypothetical protein